jgi:hypothetical protein
MSNILHSENGFISTNAIKQSILSSLHIGEAPTQDQLHDFITQAYEEAHKAEGNFLGFSTPDFANNMLAGFSIAGIGNKLWLKIKDFLCKNLQGNETEAQILDLIFQALGFIMPGGKIVEWLAKAIMKFVLQQGVKQLCKTTIDNTAIA